MGRHSRANAHHLGPCGAHVLGDDGGFWFGHCGGRIARIFERQLAGRLRRRAPAYDSFQRPAEAAFVPILVVWFGIDAGPTRVTAFLISFFPIRVNIATGLATLEPELEHVLRVLGTKRWDVLRTVGLPRCTPDFFASLKVAITLA